MSRYRGPRSRARAARLASGVAVLLGLALSACTTGPSDAESTAEANIVVTTNILGDVVSQIVGDAANVRTLMRPGADPHSFEISAQQAAQMDEADLLVSNGLGLEEGLQRHLDRVAAAGGAQFVAGDHVDVLRYAASDAHGEGAAEAVDPHFWTDPLQMVAVTEALTETLAALPALDEDARAAVTGRGTAYAAELTAVDATMKQRFAEIPPDRRALVTNHHVFGYFAERYDFEVLGTAIPGGTTLAAPSAKDLDALVTAITEARVPTIFAESSSPDRLMRVLADEAGLTVDVVSLFTESLSEPGAGADTYVAMLHTNTDRIVAGLAPGEPAGR
ncbi:metal ABC transporter substrate-binding protein [Leucobacter aridicollis]|uniref:Zinc/manganese transport system substrate-binding protein n=1 Tax=Leucobacter aridicollis TaxID=283878 RepID=A0A852RG80_9MICO|nr:metal ABC transporter substrate-binding protein [Leucobacter aridicollis]NYD27234.1 zinc/manganese transport system substrate-binding protein [Leucobacter aridicollis]